MKRTVMIEKEKHRSVGLGELKIPELNVDIEYSGTAPYAKSREDIEVLLRYPKTLREKQPIEINGFNTHSMIRRAISLQEELQDESSDYEYSPYEKFTGEHPALVSYPPEVVWLAKEYGLKTWEKNLRQILPTTEFGFEAEQIDDIIEKIHNHVVLNPQTYHFWRAIIDEKIEKESLSKIIMEWAIQNTLNARGKWISGLLPMIDATTPGSINLSHRINLAYGYLIDDKQDEGIKTPAPLYSIHLNSSMIRPDDWTPSLSEIVKNVRLAMNEDKFDGIFLYVRGIERLSSSNGRINTLLKLIEELNKISNDVILPSWYSRFGIASMRLLDMSSTFSSIPINLNHKDVYMDGYPGEEMYKYGVVINPVLRERWNRDQVIRSLSGPDNGLPRLEHYWNKNAPITREQESPFQWRIHFSKPYNIATFSNLNDRWLANVRTGESNPGREYLRSFEVPFNTWGN